jgi:hypothetical protein
MQTTERMLAEAERAGIEIALSTPPPKAGEVALLPGVRPAAS